MTSKQANTTARVILMLIEYPNLSQSEIAREIGISRQRVHQIMTNRYRLLERHRIEVAARLTQVGDSVQALQQILRGFEELEALEASNA